MLQKTMGTEGFTERHLRKYLEGVIRQAYEEHGMYRVSFPKITFQKTGRDSVDVTTEVLEGPKFTLGEVQILGENLPREAMLNAAAFDTGRTANWTEIQQKIFALEKPVKRMGFFEATAHAQRILLDEQRQLDLHISITLGPLYHFGRVTFAGLSPNDEAVAQKMWKMQTGSPYDFDYANEFVRELSRKVDLRPYKIGLQIQKAAGDHVMNETVTFAAR